MVKGSITMKPEIVPAHVDHIQWLAKNMRPADIAECAAGGLGPRRALENALHRSVAAWTGLVGGKPVCMFGVVPAGDILGGVGAPWFLAAPQIQKHRVMFLRRNREYLLRMLHIFPHLVDYVDVRHKSAVRWLNWLGFKLDSEPVSFGPLEMPFYRFEMIATDRLLTGESVPDPIT